MRVVPNVPTKASAWMLARLNESNHLVLARVIELPEKFETADAPIGSRNLKVLVHEEADCVWVLSLIHLA